MLWTLLHRHFTCVSWVEQVNSCLPHGATSPNVCHTIGNATQTLFPLVPPNMSAQCYDPVSPEIIQTTHPTLSGLQQSVFHKQRSHELLSTNNGYTTCSKHKQRSHELLSTNNGYTTCSKHKQRSHELLSTNNGYTTCSKHKQRSHELLSTNNGYTTCSKHKQWLHDLINTNNGYMTCSTQTTAT